MTKDEAVSLGESGFWHSMSSREIAAFQLNEPLLCMPFDVFHKAIEEALGRPVYTHEFGLNWDGLKRELAGEVPAPDITEIIDMFPDPSKVVIVRTP